MGGGYRTCTRSPFHIPAALTAAAPAGRIDELAEGTRRRRAGKCRIATPCVSRLFPPPRPQRALAVRCMIIPGSGMRVFHGLPGSRSVLRDVHQPGTGCSLVWPSAPSISGTMTGYRNPLLVRTSGLHCLVCDTYSRDGLPRRSAAPVQALSSLILATHLCTSGCSSSSLGALSSNRWCAAGSRRRAARAAVPPSGVPRVRRPAQLRVYYVGRG